MNILATLGLMLCDASTSASVKIIICFFAAGACLLVIYDLIIALVTKLTKRMTGYKYVVFVGIANSSKPVRIGSFRRFAPAKKMARLCIDVEPYVKCGIPTAVDAVKVARVIRYDLTGNKECRTVYEIDVKGNIGVDIHD